jgi:hypothetical protein
MKNAAFLLILVLSFIASAKTTNKADNPFPTCNPCPMVR